MAINTDSIQVLGGGGRIDDDPGPITVGSNNAALVVVNTPASYKVATAVINIPETHSERSVAPTVMIIAPQQNPRPSTVHVKYSNGNPSTALLIVGNTTYVSMPEPTMAATVVIVDKGVRNIDVGSREGFFIGHSLQIPNNHNTLILNTRALQLAAPNASSGKLTLLGNFKLDETCNIVDKNGVSIVRNGELVTQ